MSFFLRKLSWRAILWGIVVDIGATEAFGFVIGIVAGVAFAADGAKPDQFNTLLTHSPRILVAYMAAGLFFTAMGGFVSGRLAPQTPYWNAAAVGLIDTLYGFADFDGNLPHWFNALGYSATLPCALLGALVARLFIAQQWSPPDEHED